jgi:succinoglycan biosynthesis transport protein ExoP
MTTALSKIPRVDVAIAVLKRRRWYFLIPFVVLWYVSTGIVFLLPTTYLSEGRIGVESQQIPEDFVRSTISTHGGERVGLMEMRVMANAPLIGIIERLQLYNEDWDDVPKAALATRLKEDTTIDVIRDPYALRLGAIAFTVAFEHKEPEIARAVAAELTELFLNENASTRAQRAADTTDFLDRQAEKIGDQAILIDQKIAEFKQANSNALPEHLELKIGMVARAESDLRAVEMEISSAQQEQRFLSAQGPSTNLRSGGDRSMTGVDPARQLEAVKAELAEQSMKYQPEHWEVKRLEAALEALKAQVSGQGSSGGTKARVTSGQALTKTDSRYSLSTNRLKVLRDQADTLRSIIERRESEILEIPLVEIELRRLSDQYNIYMGEYSKIRANRADAELAHSLEQEEKAERFILLEAPEFQVEPTQSLFQLMLMALLCSIGGAAIIAYASEKLDDSLYGESMLVSLIGEQPLAVIPNLDGV